jgi:hypothetical protein
MMKKFYLFLLGAWIALGSCSTGDAASAAQMLGGSSQALLYLNCRAVSEDEIEFVFSRPVMVKSLNFDSAVEIDSIQDGSTVRVKLRKGAEPGMLLTADLLAEDEKKNTINVLVSFRSRNNKMPELVINELCTENGTSVNKKTEFIEFKMKSDGNLGAMRIVILGNSSASKQTIYEFLPCEVKRNEYMVLHLRTLEETCKNEYGSNLLESGGANASNARDFWIPGNTKLIQRTTSTVYVLDQDDRVLDAVMICEKPDVSWSKDYFAQAAEFLFSQGAWKSADGGICRPADAVISAGATNTRTICRDETKANSRTDADWYITATSSATPGGENSDKRY